MDGLRGPGLTGSGNYISRSALLFGSPNQKGTNYYILTVSRILTNILRILF
jgi:hypothetical protein